MSFLTEWVRFGPDSAFSGFSCAARALFPPGGSADPKLREAELAKRPKAEARRVK